MTVVGDRVGVQSYVTDDRVEVTLETVNSYLVTGPTVMVSSHRKCKYKFHSERTPGTEMFTIKQNPCFKTN